jgi:hypothetical protein
MFERSTVFVRSLMGSLVLSAALALFVPAASAQFIPPPSPGGYDMVTGHLKKQPQSQGPSRDALLQLANRPLKVGEMAVPALGAALAQPAGKTYYDATSPIAALGPQGVDRVTYRVFPNSDAAEAYVTDKRPGAANFYWDVPDGYTKRTTYNYVKETDSAGQPRFPSQFYCNFSHVEGKNQMVDACAYHPAGSVIVAIATTGEELAPGAPAEDFGSDSVKTLAVGLGIAAARNLLDFLGQK